VSAPRLLSLELQQWSTRPVGQITDERGHTIDFDGWLSLAAALERIWGAAEQELATDSRPARDPQP
jgi:hypothetical protein